MRPKKRQVQRHSAHPSPAGRKCVPAGSAGRGEVEDKSACNYYRFTARAARQIPSSLKHQGSLSAPWLPRRPLGATHLSYVCNAVARVGSRLHLPLRLDCLAAAGGGLSQPIMSPYSEMTKLRQYYCQEVPGPNISPGHGSPPLCLQVYASRNLPWGPRRPALRLPVPGADFADSPGSIPAEGQARFRPGRPCWSIVCDAGPADRRQRSGGDQPACLQPGQRIRTPRRQIAPAQPVRSGGLQRRAAPGHLGDRVRVAGRRAAQGLFPAARQDGEGRCSHRHQA